jgi:hypothetical protein
MVQSHKHVVVWDPKNEYWQGSVVDPRLNEVLVARGVVTLPCDPDIFRLSAVTGLFVRSWGAGYPVDSQQPRMHCPLLLHLLPSHHALHWAALLMPNAPEVATQVAAQSVQGTLRLAADSGQAVGLAHGLVPHGGTFTEARDLGRPNAVGGWVVRGTAAVRTQGEGLCSFALYGAIPGMRVAWAAITQTH